MISDERKGELMADLEYSVNRRLGSQLIVSEAISAIAQTEEEDTFLESLNYYFAVMLPEQES